MVSGPVFLREPMRFFFAIVKADGEIVDDRRGVDCATGSSAVAFGRSMAHDLAAEGDQYIGGSVLVRDDKGRHVERVAVRERDKPAIRMKDRVGFFGSNVMDRINLTPHRR